MLRTVSIMLPLSCVLIGLMSGCSGEPEGQEVDLNTLPPDLLVFELIKQGDLANLENVLNDSPDLVNAKGSANATPLHSAASFGEADIAKMLLDRGADPSASDDFGQTPLDVAKTAGESGVVAVLEGR